ncbi:MAG TPA: bifunctional sulfate adenylyltransferase/adenylylsulfate kinase, partial [Thermoanaerobaculia bacterium]|nr:bifunctional sulfate adenylyltransferase/adenylylsulfate kinase [Thermoanaerobaculia bacterium]
MNDRREHPIGPAADDLVNLLATPERISELKARSRDWRSWEASSRQICDLELLGNGAFSPLTGFLGRKDYESVCASLRLSNGALWPIPVTLDVSEEFGRSTGPGESIAVRDQEGVMLAALHVEEVWKPDRRAEAEAVYGTADTGHPGVAYLLERVGHWYIAGRLEVVQLPIHYDFRSLRKTPTELRREFAGRGWRRVVAFQTRNPMHRAHRELTLRAAREADATLLIHPVVGTTKPGDVDHYTRVRCYQTMLHHYPQGTARLALLPLSMRMAGPREAVWHAIIRRNYGCTHFIVGRDHAGPGQNGNGGHFYEPYAAQELLRRHEDELGVRMVPFREMVYVEGVNAHLPADEVAPGMRTLSISGTELRRRLEKGMEIPEWFTFPDVARELRRTHPPRREQGFTIFLTGLSGSGKSTIARVLLVKLLEVGGRPVTLLDGDVVRRHLSSELDFSREHRDLNIRRIGFVASEITKNSGIALCAPIAPYESVRREVRQMISGKGGFVLVHVATPLAVCEQRDRKGLYAKARAGLVQHFTGVSDPYEAPSDAEVVVDTSRVSAEDAARTILRHLEQEGYIGKREGAFP